MSAEAPTAFSADELAAAIRRERIRRIRWTVLLNSLTVCMCSMPILHDMAHSHSATLATPATVFGVGIALIVAGWSLVRPAVLLYLAIGSLWFLFLSLWLLVGFGMLPYHPVLGWVVALVSLCVLAVIFLLVWWVRRFHERTPAQEYVVALRRRLWARNMSRRRDCVSFLVTRSGGYYRVLLLPDVVFFSSIEFGLSQFVAKDSVAFSAGRKTLFGRIRGDIRFGAFNAHVSISSPCAEHLRRWLTLSSSEWRL